MPSSSRRRDAASSDAPAAAPRVRRRYHFSSNGLVYILVTLLIALGAFNAQNNLLFWAFGFSLAILMVSGFLSGAMLMGLSVHRERIRDVHAGEPLTIKYRVRNANRLVPCFALTIEESWPTLRRKSAKKAWWRARHRSTPLPQSPPIDQPRAFAAHVGPRETLLAEAIVRTHRRGIATFRSVTVSTGFPFGLMRKSLEVEEPASTVVLPAPAPVDAALLDAAASAGDSTRSSRIRGPGDEFHSLREYVSGDNPRSIAWKASARRGFLLVRQSLAPAPTRLWLVLRLRISPMDTDVLDERAISIAAGLIERARARSTALGISVPLVGLTIPPRADAAHYERLLRELGQLDLGSSDARGVRAPFPLAAGSHRAACVCIHAGAGEAIDPTYGPPDRVIHRGVVEGPTTDSHARRDGRRGPFRTERPATISTPVRP